MRPPWGGRPVGSLIASAFALGFCVVAIDACASHERYVPPTVEAPPAFKEDANWKPAEPRDEAIRGAWWEIFGDDRLTELEQRIDVSNQNLKAAEAQFAEARAAVRATRASLYPQVQANAGISANQASGTRAISTFHNVYGDNILTGDASYEVDAWGRIRSTVSASVASAQASAADLETARLSLHAELALDYVAVQSLDRDKQLLDEAVRAYEQAFTLTQNRFQGGLVSQADVAQAETQLETTRAQSVDTGVQRAAFEHAIAVLIGETASTFSLPVSPLTKTPPGVPEAVPSDVLERRPDIAAAERRVAAANAQIGVARAAFFPLITLSGAGGFESSGFGRLLSGASSLWSVGPAAVLTVFDAGRRRAVSAEALAVYDQTTADYRDAVLSAFRDVEDQLAALRILEDEAQVQDRAVNAAERSLALVTNRYRGGIVSYLEVIVAQTAALINEETAVNILARRMSASILLLKALGGGWTTAALPQPATLPLAAGGQK